MYPFSIGHVVMFSSVLFPERFKAQEDGLSPFWKLMSTPLSSVLRPIIRGQRGLRVLFMEQVLLLIV